MIRAQGVSAATLHTLAIFKDMLPGAMAAIARVAHAAIVVDAADPHRGFPDCNVGSFQS